MKNKLFSFVGILAIMLVFGMTFAGCATQIMSLTMGSTHNVDLSRMGEFRRTSSEVRGTTSKLSRILIFDVSFGDINLERAVDNALRRIPGAVALINLRVSVRKLNFLVFALDQYIVTGSALVDPNIASIGKDENVLPELVTFDETGEIIEIVQITQDEFNQYLAIADYKITE